MELNFRVFDPWYLGVFHIINNLFFGGGGSRQSITTYYNLLRGMEVGGCLVMNEFRREPLGAMAAI